MNKQQPNLEKKMSQLPSWLWTTSNLLPPIYRQIWEGVKEARSVVYATQSTTANEILVDTNKVFPLLLTSQLPTEVLGYIWSLANHKFSGQLTEQELYVVLALVAIAQASYTFNSLDVLHLIPSPPIPNLNLSLIEDKRSTTVEIKSEIVKSQQVNSSFDTSDEFSEFQSAPAITIPSIPILDTKQGSAIGSRLANHNLGVKKFNDKPKKFNASKHGTTIVNNNQARNSNGREQQIANEQLGTEIFPKCSLKTQSKVVILKDTAIRSSEVLKDNNFAIKDAAITAQKISHPLDNAFSIPGPRENISKISQKKGNEINRSDLMSVQPLEDKYSALRILVKEPQPQAEKIETETAPTDDFGDFVSAVETETVIKDNGISQEPIDFFSSFEFRDSNFDNGNENSLIRGISDSFSNLRIETAPHPVTQIKEFDFTNDSDKVVPKEDNISVNSIELGNGTIGCLPRSGSVPSLDLKCFLTNSQDDDHQIESVHQLIYWEWKQYMESCVLLLQVAANIFTGITSEDVLNEVLLSAQGYNFLCNLAEVAAVCRRVNFSHKELDINIIGFDDLLMDIDRTWAEMEPFYSNIPIVTELPVWPLHQGENIICSLCLTVVTSGRIVYNENSYHLSCANLWLNCINNNLPALSHPMPSSLTMSNSHV